MDTEMYIELLEEKIRRQRSKVRGARKQVAERDEKLNQAAKAAAGYSGAIERERAMAEAKITTIRVEVLKAHAVLAEELNRQNHHGLGGQVDPVLRAAYTHLDDLVGRIR